MTFPKVISDTFLYFAYGSNLLAKRIHLQNPSAVRKNIGKIKGYKLDFAYYAPRWGGAPATIIPETDQCVWGAIWEISMANLQDLDRQEGVHCNVYQVKTIPVETPNGETLTCRVYQLHQNPNDVSRQEIMPSDDSKPSRSYMSVIVNGAIESGLPNEYISYLKSVQHNGKVGDKQLIESLDLNEVS